MSENANRHAGGCLCGALRYEAHGAPMFTGLCYCADCQKASGSGFIPFMGFASSAVRFIGPTQRFTTKSHRGTDAVRNFCPTCGSLVFGGIPGEDTMHTIYAGTLDDRSLFQPRIAIFARSRPDWAVIPPGLQVFETMPASPAP
jgi:hypothetical protein